MTAPTRPVLRYHGGKWRLAPWIIAHFPAHRVYVEPFAGAASVLLRKPRSYSEVYNDRDGEVVSLFAVLRDPAQAAELERRTRLTPFARDEFEASYAPTDDILERARQALVRGAMGFGSAAFNSKHSTGFRSGSKRSGTTPAHDWGNYPDRIAQFTSRLAGVVIENRPAEQVIRAQDSRETLFYVDPPYPHSTRGNVNGVRQKYRHEMTDDEHRALALVLHAVEGIVVLSGYACDLYDRELYVDWRRVTKETHADGARDRTEVLWLNPACAAALPPTLDLDAIEPGAA